jgi:hypothetical protein
MSAEGTFSVGMPLHVSTPLYVLQEWMWDCVFHEYTVV